MAKNNCIYCDNKIDQQKGKSVLRCTICNNTMHEKHSDMCAKCEKTVCMNDIKIKDGEVFCRNCAKV